MRTVNDAPCVCVNESRSEGDHQEMHNVQGVMEESFRPGGANHDPSHPSWGWTYAEGKRAGLHAHEATFSSGNPDNQCDSGCLEAQLDAFYDTPEDTPLNRPHRRQPIGDEPRETTNRSWSGVINGPR